MKITVFRNAPEFVLACGFDCTLATPGIWHKAEQPVALATGVHEVRVCLGRPPFVGPALPPPFVAEILLPTSEGFVVRCHSIRGKGQIADIPVGAKALVKLPTGIVAEVWVKLDPPKDYVRAKALIAGLGGPILCR